MDDTHSTNDINTKIDLLHDENNRKISIGFVISLFSSIFAISLLCLIIMKVPALDSFHVTLSQLEYDNFFFSWDFKEVIPFLSYTFNSITLSTGFYLFMPIITVLFFISSSTVLIKNLKEQRICLIVNIVLGLIPVILFPVRMRYIRINFSFIPILMQLLFHLGVFSLYFLPIQLLILIHKKDFLQWSGLKEIQHEEEESSSINRIFRKINFILGIFACLIIAVVPYLTIYQQSNLFPILSTKEFLLELLPMHVIFALLCWMWFDITFLYWHKSNRKISGVISFFMPVFFGFAAVYFNVEKDYLQPLFVGYLSYSKSTDILLSYAFCFSFFIYYSLAIGFYSIKNDHLIIAAIHSIFYIGFFAFILSVNWGKAFLLTIKIGIIFQYPLIILSIFSGALLGRFLANRIKSTSKNIA